MDLKRILVAVDSTNDHRTAFERALALARASGAELYLLHAVLATEPFSFGAAGRLSRMAALRARAEEAGVPVHAVEQHGDPAGVIELHANTRDVDLVVLGSSRGRRRSRLAERVIRRTRVPALVVPGDHLATLRPFRRVLVAVDLSATASDVLHGAVALAAAEAQHLTVLHAVSGLGLGARSRADARDALRALATMATEGLDLRVEVATGSPARAIVRGARALEADLVVVGRGRRFALLGSTAEGVLRDHDGALLVLPAVWSRTGARVPLQPAA